MSFKEFSYYVEENIRKFLPEEIRKSVVISVHPIRKSHIVQQYGLMIRMGNEKVIPIFYLGDAWKKFEGGMEMKAVLGNLVQEYLKYRDIQRHIHMNASMEFEAVKDRVVYQVLNKEVSRNSLRERVYTDIGYGLVKVYVILHELDDFGTKGGTAITNNMMQYYGYDMQDIQAVAEKNTPRIYPADFIQIEQVLTGRKQNEFANENSDGEGLYVLSNSDAYRGAGGLFYPGMQEKIAEHFGKNYYVLPCSVHEVLILPEKPGLKVCELEQKVRRINREAVSKEDFLSNKVLFYDREKEQLRIALPDVPDLQLEDQNLER